MKKTNILIILAMILGFAVLISGGEKVTAQAEESLTVPVDQIIVKYKDVANLNQAAQAQSSAQVQRLNDISGVTIEYFRRMSGDAHVMRLGSPLSAAEAALVASRLETLPEVAYAEPDYKVFTMEMPAEMPFLAPDDTRYPEQWHYLPPSAGNYGVNATAAWDITTGSSGVFVAVLDTGITDHVDLAGRWTGGYDMIADPWVANDGDGRDSNPRDPGDWYAANECGYVHNPSNSSWHGTHVAGTIGAATNNNMGVAGLNWVSQIIPVRVLGKCGGYTSDISDGIRWAAGVAVAGTPMNPNPAQVINMSLGGYGACGTSYQNAINDAVSAGSTVVVAAGNSADNAGSYRPANCNQVITVASTNRYGSLAYYSNYGTTVEISAPGGETNVYGDGVLSTLNSGMQGPSGDTYTFYQGTSMAAPHIAGVASLLYSVNSALTPAEVLSIMQSTVTPFPGSSICSTSICGSGIVNAAAALAAVPGAFPDAPTIAPISNPDGDGSFTVDWNDVANANSYTLQEANNPSFSSPATIYSGPNSQYAVSGKTGGTWYYRVQASNAAGPSSWSAAASAVVKPAQPTLNPIFNPGDLDAYLVSWNASAGADGYLLQESMTNTFTSPTTRYMGSNMQYAVTGQAGGTWYYRVQASNAAGSSSWSITEMISVTVSILTAPVLAPINNPDQDVDFTVAWADVISATSYIVEESDNPYFVNPVVIYTGSMTQTQITDKAVGQWYYRVRASDGPVYGPWSNMESTKTGRTIFLPITFKN